MKNVLLILFALIAQVAFAQTNNASSEDFGNIYGFMLQEPKMSCNGGIFPKNSGNAWSTLCESGSETADYVGIVSKAKTASVPAMHRDFGNKVLLLLGDNTVRQFNCVGDTTTKDDFTGMQGFFVDCKLNEAGSQKAILFSSFYFSPKTASGADIFGKGIIFSDFGKGTLDQEAFKAKVRERIKNFLKQAPIPTK